jgi:hypothetical protein
MDHPGYCYVVPSPVFAESNARRIRESRAAAAAVARRALDSGVQLPGPYLQALELRAANPGASWAALGESAGTTGDALGARYRRGLAMAARRGGCSGHDGADPRSAAAAARRQRIVATARAEPLKSPARIGLQLGVSPSLVRAALRDAGLLPASSRATDASSAREVESET